MKKKYFYLLLITVIVGFTAYVLLDTFVISRVYSKEVTAESAKTSDNVDVDAAKSAVKTANSYSDGNISISITKYEQNDTVIYAADIKLSDASLLKTALAQKSYGRNVTEATSSIAERVGAILAINGDFYGSRESGYVIRGGTLYRDTPSTNDALAIYEDGSFKIINQSDISAYELLDDGAINVFSFGPARVENGKVTVNKNTEVGKAMANNPRTAIGLIDDLHYVFVVSDGRTNESSGLSLYELAGFMEKLGVKTAYNFDGGGSSTMVFDGKVINNPTTNGKSIKERSVSDIVYIGY